MFAFKRQKTETNVKVHTLVVGGLTSLHGLCCLPDGCLLLTTTKKIMLYVPGAVVSCAVLSGRDFRGYTNGPSSEASYNNLWGVMLNLEGNIVVADTNNHSLRLVSKATGVCKSSVRTLAGSRDADGGFSDGPVLDDLDAEFASFRRPSSTVLLPSGDIVILDTGNHALRVLESSGRVRTLAGNGTAGFADGDRKSAQFNSPCGLAYCHVSKRLVVADTGNHSIRVVCLHGSVSTMAGCGAAGFQDGACAGALLASPTGVAVDGAGKILVADLGNNCIRAIENPRTALARMVTIAGSHNEPGHVDGLGAQARFKEPKSLTIDHHGRLLVTELGAFNRIRIIDAGLEPPPIFYEVEPEVMRMHFRVSASLQAFQDFDALRADSGTADVVFVVGHAEFPAHRALVAARCEYLAALMRFQENRKYVAVAQVSAQAFAVVLKYLYATEMPVVCAGGPGASQDVAREVMVTADKWRLDDLCQHCVHEFKQALRVETCVECLVWAVNSGPPQARMVAMDFFLRSRQSVCADAPDTFKLLRCLSREDAQDVLLQVLMA